MENTTPKPLREFLAGIKNVENIEDGYSGHLLDVVCREAYFLCSHPGGHINVTCSGKAIMGFAPCTQANGVGAGAIYLILNDRAGELWDVKFRGGQGVHQIGCRPCEKLTLVQSA